MAIKLAADLQPGDAVMIAAEDRRVVQEIEFVDRPIVPGDSCAVRVRWVDRDRTNLLSPMREMAIDGPAEVPTAVEKCQECWTPAGEPHELSCSQVSLAVFLEVTRRSR